jgi:hypothetical protein
MTLFIPSHLPKDPISKHHSQIVFAFLIPYNGDCISAHEALGDTQTITQIPAWYFDPLTTFLCVH